MELQYSKENLQTTIEELETSNEELKSTNEELQSTNEELQSTNEELETSKEELQSLNEESATVNAELQAGIDELSKSNDDMKNLLDSTEIATIFLDTELRVRRFTPRATEIIPLTAADAGRPIKHLVSSLVDTDIASYSEAVLDNLAVQEAEVQSSDDRSFIMRIRPYRTVSNVIEGVVITFQDITEVTQATEALRHSEQRSRLLLENSPVCSKIIDLDSRLQYMSAAGREQLGISDIEPYYGQPYPLSFYPESLRVPLVEHLKRAIAGETCSVEGAVHDTSGREVLYRTTFVPSHDGDGRVEYVVATSVNITDRNQAD
jgi:two-component system CheB/CheR fusion protein